MKNNVRTVFFSSDVEEDNPVQHNIDLQRQLVDFLDNEEGAIYVGDIKFTRRSVAVTFEALDATDPDRIMREYGSAASQPEPTDEDASHGPDDDGPVPTPTDTPAADTGEPDASDADTDDGEPTPDPDDGDEPFVLVDEEGEGLASFATEEEAWDAFEKHETAFDVVER